MTDRLRSALEDLADQARAGGDVHRAVREVRTLRRRRAGLAAIAATIALAVTVPFLAGFGRSSSDNTPVTSSPSSHGPVLDATRTSHLLKYTMSYPASWRVRTATRPWVFGKPGDGATSPTTDLYRSRGGEAFYVSSQRLPPGLTAHQWLHHYQRQGLHQAPVLSCWPSLPQWTSGSIAGRRAWVHGGEECNFTEAVTFAGHRAYVFTGAASLSQCCSLFDPKLFAVFLDSVQLSSR